MNKKEIQKLYDNEKKIIKEAINAALISGLDQIVFYDGNGELNVVRDYPTVTLYKDDVILGRVFARGKDKPEFVYQDVTEIIGRAKFEELVSSSKLPVLNVMLDIRSREANNAPDLIYRIKPNPDNTYDVSVFDGKTIIGTAEGLSLDEIKLDDRLGGHYVSESNGLKSIYLTIHKELPELQKKHNDIER